MTLMVVVMTAVEIMQTSLSNNYSCCFYILIFPIVSLKLSSVAMVECLVCPLSPFILLMVANCFSVWIFDSVGRDLLKIMCREERKVYSSL